MRFRRARMLDLVSGRASEPHDVLVSGSRLYRSDAVPGSSAGDDEVIDLQGRFILPGLWDAHVHTDLWAQASHRIDLSGADSSTRALDALTRNARLSSREPVVALSAPLERWPSPLDGSRLDALFPERAVIVCSRDLHSVWANGMALLLAGLAADPNTRPAARLAREQDAFTLERHFLRPSQAELDEWCAQSAAEAARKGIVGIVDMQDGPARLATWRRRIAAGCTFVRICLSCWPDTLDEAIDSGMTTGARLDDRGWLLGGPLKIIADGSLSSGTAWSSTPYSDPAPGIDAHGLSLIGRPELSGLMSRAEVHGLQVAVHAIGDAAVSQALDCFAESGARGSIEHAILARADDLARMASLGVRASVQPAHLLQDRALLERRWPTRCGDAFPLRSCLDAGVELRFGSDAPVVDLDPWQAISAAVLRAEPGAPSWHCEQSLTVGEAMRASTGGAAQLVPGGSADLMVLDDDPLQVDPSALGSTEVYLTMATGKVTWWADAA
ncbi:hypothetical protein SAMN05443377_102159 [Propionibacterium cyclohexanicum]|uniref:Amidohydrolase 3 domain-containing protein n=1 Tax=Propionibacterium cyclohexanicum TaxID=64702 RepID=A0A1H9Q827_9ACTN|nr:amidohydrolase family protein [Propionibacterium cyclohexanicum]SER56049.1 hypothetical protein SAMN05443377_102159 [Propionibacterium cyclohexanicum]